MQRMFCCERGVDAAWPAVCVCLSYEPPSLRVCGGTLTMAVWRCSNMRRHAASAQRVKLVCASLWECSGVHSALRVSRAVVWLRISDVACAV